VQVPARWLSARQSSLTPSREQVPCKCLHFYPQLIAAHVSMCHTVSRTLDLASSAAARTVTRAGAVQVPAHWLAARQPQLTLSREHVPGKCLHGGFWLVSRRSHRHVSRCPRIRICTLASAAYEKETPASVRQSPLTPSREQVPCKCLHGGFRLVSLRSYRRMSTCRASACTPACGSSVVARVVT
jgi:hypothetical protein